MSISQQVLAERLKRAREASGLSQDEVAKEIGIPRSAVAQTELANRSVSSIELSRFAYLYGRDLSEFLAEEFDAERSLAALFRAAGQPLNSKETLDALRHCASLGRELTNLERLVGIDRDPSAAIRYALPAPRSTYDAIRQGAAVAEQERRRLSLGDSPVSDLVILLETQGVRTAIIDLPDGVSGLTLVDQEIGPLVVVNLDEHWVRRRFSFAHEYAHVLIDCDRRGRISLSSQKADYLEVRANSFAANFLMPQDGVRRFLESLGKSSESKLFAETPTDDDQTELIEARNAATRSIQLHDVVLLAHHFGVSRSMAIYRLRNLKILSPRELDALLDQDRERGTRLSAMLQLGSSEVENEREISERERFKSRFLGLALEAFQAGSITRSKLREVYAAVLNVRKDEIDIEDLTDGAANEVLLPYL